MWTSNSWVLFFAACFAFGVTYGWKPNTHYTYSYNGRVATAIKELKQQWALIHVTGILNVQSHEAEDTLIVKFSNGRFQHTPDFVGNPYEIENDETKEFDGPWETMQGAEHLETPFVITHQNGSITNVKISADDPLWVVNMKKAVASQLQLDATGVRRVEELKSSNYTSSSEQSNTAFSVYEDGVNGDCTTLIQVNRLPDAQTWNWSDQYDSVCKGAKSQAKHFFEVTKTKDFNHCSSIPHLNWAVPSLLHTCDMGAGNCGDALKRSSTGKYIACGVDPTDWTYIRIEGYGEFIVQPFGTGTEKVINAAITRLTLQSKELLSAPLSPPHQTITWNSLSYTFPEVYTNNGTRYVPDLKSAWLESPAANKTSLVQTLLALLHEVADEIQESTDSKKDSADRLLSVRNILPLFSLDELSILADQVNKSQYPLVWDMFIDCVVATGTNPAVMFIKDMLEKKEINGEKAVWTVVAMGHYVKTPTTELLRQLVKLMKSEAVASNKELRQAAFINFADLFAAACDSPVWARNRFPTNLVIEFCTGKDSVLFSEFMPMLTQWLTESESKGAEHMMALTALGNLGVEESLPWLLPHIHGNDVDDVARRTRAIFSLQRVMYSNPERVYPMLTTIADNIAERPEVRMAAITLLLSPNTPLAIWQKIAYRTWFDSSQQVQSFTYSVLRSLASVPPTTLNRNNDMITKARLVVDMTKPFPSGEPWSSSQTYYSSPEPSVNILSSYSTWKVSDEHYPVLFAMQSLCKFGPLFFHPLQIQVWNYNVEDLWLTLMEHLTGFQLNTPSTGRPVLNRPKKRSPVDLNDVWSQLKPKRRPADKRMSFLHVNLMGSMHRTYDLSEMVNSLPQMWQAKLIKVVSAAVSNVFPVNLFHFHNLAEVNLQFPNELGFPTRFLAQMPIIISSQGKASADLSIGAFETDTVTRFSFKLCSEVRTDLPFTASHHIAAGVDVRTDIHAPRRINFKFNKRSSQLKIVLPLGPETNDIFYYHVKPYTVSRDWLLSWSTPVVEDLSNTQIVVVSQKPNQRDYNLPLDGVHVQWSSYSEHPHDDRLSFWQWWSKFDINSFLSTSFVPFSLRHSQYRLQYVPDVNETKSVSFLFQPLHYWKSSANNIKWVSGTNQDVEVVKTLASTSDREIPEDFRPIIDRLFKSLEDGSGDAQMYLTALRLLRKDGSSKEIVASYGYVRDELNKQAFSDYRLLSNLYNVNKTKSIEFGICGFTKSNWRPPPAFGLSTDPLFLSHETTFQLGATCDTGARVSFNASLKRDEKAGEYVKNTRIASRCLKEIQSGLIDSPTCREARRRDQTFNVYQLDVELSKVCDDFAYYWLPLEHQITSYLLPFIQDYRMADDSSRQNESQQRKWSVRAQVDAATGHVDLLYRQPWATIDAKDVRRLGASSWIPMADRYLASLFPVQGDRTLFESMRSVYTAGVSDAKCFVGPESVVTFDNVSYNYTISKCNHVLVTDCWQKARFAVLARNFDASRKLVQLVLEKDLIEIDPVGVVTINGAVAQPVEGGRRFELYDGNAKNFLLAVVWWADKAVKMHVPSMQFEMLLQGNQITLSAPWAVRGRSCGLCGDYDQEITNEFKSASRCAFSSGSMMATSFQIRDSHCNDPATTRSGHTAWNDMLAEKDNPCRSVDEHITSDLPFPETDRPTKCSAYRSINMALKETQSDSLNFNCQSTYPVLQCEIGCSPTDFVSKVVDFKCSHPGLEDKEVRRFVSLPLACVST